MELRHLRYFVAVAESGSLSRAAEKLFIAQPPLSTQIRQFEEQLGAELFTRHPKGVRLTEAGHALLPEVHYLLDRAARLRDTARNASDASLGRLRLGYVPSASSTVLPQLLRALRRLHPRLSIELREMISTEQAEALVAGQIDAGIVRSAVRHSRLVVTARMADPFCLAVPAGHAAADTTAVDLRSCADEVFVSFTRHLGPAYFDQSIHLCSQAGFSPRIRYEASTVHGVLDLVSAELGIALVPASASMLPIQRVVIRPLRRQDPREELCLLRRKSDPNPLLPTLDTCMAEVLAALRPRVLEAIGVRAGSTSRKRHRAGTRVSSAGGR